MKKTIVVIFFFLSAHSISDPFTEKAEEHLDIQSVPVDKLYFHHSLHIGIVPEIFVLSGQSRKWSQSLFITK